MNVKKLFPIFGLASTATCLVSPAMGDVFHNANLLVGDRAVGLGGAFCAISDDASGVYYNPAGLAFAIASDVSGSANAYYRKNVVYKKTIGSSDFEERSEGLAPSFFGGLQKMDAIVDGLAVGFALYSPDNELKNQNDLFEAPTPLLKRFHRTANVRASTLHFGVAAAKMIGTRFSIGLTVRYVTVDELTQSYQDTHAYIGQERLKTINPANGNVSQLRTANLRELVESKNVEPVLGFQFAATPSLSMGLAIRVPVNISENYENSQDIQLVRMFDNNAIVNVSDIDVAASVEEDVKRLGISVRGNTNEKYDKSIGGLAKGIRAGIAWFPSNRFVWSLDADYSHRVENEKNTYQAQYNREPVVNVFTGVEYFILPTFLSRFGLFSNRDARPVVDSSAVASQIEHIDYYGGSAILGMAQENSQINAGLVYQKGFGKAQKTGSTKEIQEIDASIATLVFSASHSF